MIIYIYMYIASRQGQTHPEVKLFQKHKSSVNLVICCCKFFQLNDFVLFVGVEALRPSQQFFSHIGTFSWVEPVLSNEDEVSCSRTQHCAPGEIRSRDLSDQESATLPAELNVLLK